MVTGAALLDYDPMAIWISTCSTVATRSCRAFGAIRQDATNQLFRQEADGHFVNVTAESGLGDQGYGVWRAAGDINNDGYPDIT